MWDRGIPDEVYAPLAGIAEIDRQPPDRTFLLNRLHEYDVLLPSLRVQVDREIVERAAQGRLRLVYNALHWIGSSGPGCLAGVRY